MLVVSILTALGVLAALLQVLGYILYIGSIFASKTIPNPASWLMFAYGTALVVFLERASGATTALLLLPIACAGMSIFVASLCFARAFREEVDAVDGAIFLLDIVLTALYFGVAFYSGNAAEFAPLLLIAGAILTVATFVPLLRSTWRDSGREQSQPWLVWTCAYAVLTLATIIGDAMTHPALLLYPLVNFGLHGVMLMLSRRVRAMPKGVSA
jgi:hypothetical protein